MKKFLFSAVIFSLFIFGCSQDVGINEPAQQKQQVQVVSAQKSLIKLTADSGLLTEAQLSIGGLIDGRRGGFITGSKRLRGRRMRDNVMTASLYIPHGAFKGRKYINVLFDNQDASIQFTPSPMEFDKPLTLNFSIVGLDYSEINIDAVDFVYINNQGEFEKVQYESIEKDEDNGTLTVIGAKLNHFSRYGFVD